MSNGRVLVTGGAGFIGSHLVDRLLELDYEVRIFDALAEQVHGSRSPSYLNRTAEFVRGDVRDATALAAALRGCELIVHFAAAVGVGQSNYEVSSYCATNVLGTANLLETLVKSRPRPRKLLVASSMSAYGEGLYACASCGPQSPPLRPAAQLGARDWAMRCPSCARSVDSRPTPESKPLQPTSIYAVNKRDQEEMVLCLSRSIGVPAVALRFFNVYGERQALSNPYTGVAAIFSSALLNGRRPLVFEDGLQQRDFVHVSDVVEASVRALERPECDEQAINVGTGRPTDLLTLLALLRREIPGAESIEPNVVGRFREGDIRACYADVAKARDLLGFEARVRIEDGVKQLARWVGSQQAHDRAAEALADLERHDLVR